MSFCLCAGDPMLYGSVVTLSARLQDQFPVKVVPGVSSLTASAAVLGQALAMRDDSFAVIPATRPEADIERLVLGTDAAAIIKLGRHVAKVARVLERVGLANRARCVRKGRTAGANGCARWPKRWPWAPYFSMILVHRRGDAWRGVTKAAPSVAVIALNAAGAKAAARICRAPAWRATACRAGRVAKADLHFAEATSHIRPCSKKVCRSWASARPVS